MKKIKSIISYFLIFAFLLMCMIPLGSVYAAKRSDDFEITIQSSSYDVDGNLTVEIGITNNGKDMRGSMVLSVQDSNVYAYNGYAKDIVLPAGSTKTYDFYIPTEAMNGSDELNVLIYDTKDKLLQGEKFDQIKAGASSSGTTKSSYVIGILSDTPDKILYIGEQNNNSGYYVATQDGYYAEILSATDIVDYLDDFDMLVINDYDTSTLSDEQISTIESWVSSGGSLVIGTGANKDLSIQGFSDSFVDVDVVGSYTESVYDYDTYQSTATDAADIMPGYSYDSYSGTYDYYYTKRSGRGNIYVVIFDLGDDVLSGTVTGYSIVTDLLNLAIGYNTSSGYNSYSSYSSMYTLDSDDFENIKGYHERSANFGAIFVGLLVVVYIIFVGPILYLILKGMKKQEKIWLVIPATTLIVTVMIMIISLGITVRGVQSESLVVDDMTGGKSYTYVYGYNPKSKDYTIKVDNNYDKYYNKSEYDWSSEPTKMKSIIKMTGSNVELTATNNEMFEMKCFVMEGSVGQTDNLSLSCNANSLGITGTVTNSTNMKFDYVIVFNNEFYQLTENVSPNQTINIDTTERFNTYSYSKDNYSKMMEAKYRRLQYSKAGEMSTLKKLASKYSDGTVYAIGIKKNNSVTKDKEDSWYAMICN